MFPCCVTDDAQRVTCQGRPQSGGAVGDDDQLAPIRLIWLCKTVTLGLLTEATAEFMALW